MLQINTLQLLLWKQGNDTIIFTGKIWNTGFLKVFHRCYIVPQLLKENGLLRALRGLDALAMALPVSPMPWVEIHAGCGKGSFHHLLAFKRKLDCFIGKPLFRCGQGFIRTSLWYAFEYLLWILSSLFKIMHFGNHFASRIPKANILIVSWCHTSCLWVSAAGDLHQFVQTSICVGSKLLFLFILYLLCYH